MLKMAKTGCGGQAAVRPKSLKRSIGPEGAAWPKCPKRAAAQRPLAPKRQLGWREAPAAKSSLNLERPSNPRGTVCHSLIKMVLAKMEDENILMYRNQVIEFS